MPDLTFFDEHEAPQPREKIRLERVQLEPYSDGRRVKVRIQITPFGADDRPNLKITVRNSESEEVASMDVVESLEHNPEFTIHLRGETISSGPYPVQVDLYYDPADIQHSLLETFIIPT